MANYSADSPTKFGAALTSADPLPTKGQGRLRRRMARSHVNEPRSRRHGRGTRDNDKFLDLTAAGLRTAVLM
jgi:hypothetical protein